MAGLADDHPVPRAILQPYFNACRDVFLAHHVSDEQRLSRLRRTKWVINPEAHDEPRHFARCRDDGLLIELAPEMVDLSEDEVTAIICHELGHAADFLYPACWAYIPGAPAVWLGDAPEEWSYTASGWENGAFVEATRSQLSSRDHGLTKLEAKRLRAHRDAWPSRPHAVVEATADAIAWAVTGQQIRYCGSCLLQCFSAQGVSRPDSLR